MPKPVLAWLLAAVALIKLGVLVGLGPTISPDTVGYAAFSDAILNGSAFTPVAWGADPTPALLFRTAGYPLVLAAAKLVAPGSWAPHVVVILQGALSLLAMALIFRVCECLFAGPAWAAVATLLYAGSGSLFWDNALLPNSLYGSLFNIVIFALLGGALGCWRISPLRAGGLGLLWGYSLWTRDSGLYFSYLPALLLLLGPGARGPAWRRLAPLGIFVVIVAAMVGAYGLFNFYRTGDTFFSLSGLANILHPMFDMRRNGYADPFTGSDLIAQTARGMSSYDLPAQLRFLGELHQRCHCTASELQALVVAKYIATVMHHPLAYLRIVAGNFALTAKLADPFFSFGHFAQLGAFPSTGAIAALSLGNLAALGHQASPAILALTVIAAGTKLTSGLLIILFTLGVPWLWLREWRRAGSVSGELWAMAFLWFVFVSISLAFSLVRFEPHHAVPVLAAAEIGMVYVLWRVIAWRRLRRPA